MSGVAVSADTSNEWHEIPIPMKFLGSEEDSSFVGLTGAQILYRMLQRHNVKVRSLFLLLLLLLKRKETKLHQSRSPLTNMSKNGKFLFFNSKFGASKN